MRNEAPLRITPISSLNPYMNRWTIRVRVTNQPAIRTWHNARGDGKVLNVDLLDSEGGEIKAVCFNDTAEKFSQVFQGGRVYDISKGAVSQVKNKKYSGGAEFEIRLDNTSSSTRSRIRRLSRASRRSTTTFRRSRPSRTPWWVA